MPKGSELERGARILYLIFACWLGAVIARGSLEIQALGGLGRVAAKTQRREQNKMARLKFVDGKEARIGMASTTGKGGKRMRTPHMIWFLLLLEAFAKFLDYTEPGRKKLGRKLLKCPTVSQG